LGCCVYALCAFDWSAVFAVISKVRWISFFATATPLMIGIFLLSAVRWIAITGQEVSVPRFRDAYLYVTVVAAFAMTTPMQLGETLKIRFAHRAGLPIVKSTVALIFERATDFLVIFWMAGISSIWRGGLEIAIVAAVFGTAVVLVLPRSLRKLARWSSGTRIGPALAPFRDETLPLTRFAILLICTIGKWLFVAALWQAAIASVSVSIDFPASMLLVAVVTTITTLSMVPGGIGVAEVSTRAILISFGVPAVSAEAAAIGIRLLSPLMIALGLLHLPVLMLAKAPPLPKVRSSSS
jgi:uncharacterized membrane protein YbhN (UPF0104 family)